MTLKLTLFFALFPLFFVIFLPEFTKFSPFSQKISEIFREFLKSAANSQKTRFWREKTANSRKIRLFSSRKNRAGTGSRDRVPKKIFYKASALLFF